MCGRGGWEGRGWRALPLPASQPCRHKRSADPGLWEGRRGHYFVVVTENEGLEEEETVTVEMPLCLYAAEEFPRESPALLSPRVVGIREH